MQGQASGIAGVSADYFKLLSPDEDTMKELFEEMGPSTDGLLTKEQVKKAFARKVSAIFVVSCPSFFSPACRGITSQLEQQT